MRIAADGTTGVLIDDGSWRRVFATALRTHIQRWSELPQCRLLAIHRAFGYCASCRIAVAVLQRTCQCLFQRQHVLQRAVTQGCDVIRQRDGRTRKRFIRLAQQLQDFIVAWRICPGILGSLGGIRTLGFCTFGNIGGQAQGWRRDWRNGGSSCRSNFLGSRSRLLPLYILREGLLTGTRPGTEYIRLSNNGIQLERRCGYQLRCN
ncbi:hypothetical protein D3C72_528200 [compost metagenome]